MRQILASLLILFALPVAAAEITTTPLQLPTATVEYLSNPVQGAPGELWVTGTIGHRRQRYRYSYSGALLGSGHSSELEFFEGAGELRSTSWLGEEFSAHCRDEATSYSGVLRWNRHSSCGSGQIDGAGRYWWVDAQHLSYSLADGSTRKIRSMSQLFGSADIDLRMLSASRAGGAVVAIRQNGVVTEVARFDHDFNRVWRFTPTLAAGESVRGLRAVEVAGDHLVVVGMLQVDGAVNGVLYLARLNSVGQPLLERRYEDIGLEGILQVKSVQDRVALSMATSPFTSLAATAKIGYAILAADGSVLAHQRTEQEFWLLGTTMVAQADHSMALFTNQHVYNADGAAFAWYLDGHRQPSALDIGQFEGALVVDGRTLVFGRALGNSALVYDGAANAGRQAFTPARVSPEVSAAVRDGSDGYYTSSQPWQGDVSVTRYGPDGARLWQTAIAAEDSLYYRSSNLLVPDSEHVCIEFERFLHCLRASDGHVLFRTEGAKWVRAGDGFIDLINTESSVRHRRISSLGHTVFDRDLGPGQMTWLTPGEVMVRSGDLLITSNASAASPTTKLLPEGDPRRESIVLAQFGPDDYLFGPDDDRYDDFNFPLPVPPSNSTPLTRYAQGVERWRVPGRVVHSALIANPGQARSAVVLERGPTELEEDEVRYWEEGFISSLDSETGSELWKQKILGLFGAALAVDPQSAAVLRLRGVAGQIIVETWDGLGGSTGSRMVSCPGYCRAQDARIEGSQVDLVAVGDDQAFLGHLPAITPIRAPRPDQRGISGVFVSTKDVNRGYLIDYIPAQNTIFAARFAGETSSQTDRRRLDWETFQGAGVAVDGQIALTRFSSRDGEFGRNTTIGSTVPSGSAVLSFDGCDQARLELTANSVSTRETIHLRRLGPRQTTCEYPSGPADPAQTTRAPRGSFDQRQSGAWLVADVSAQGLLAAVEPATATSDGLLFAAWFTYWPNAADNPETDNRSWLTLQGSIPPNASNSVTLGIYRSTAGSHVGVEIHNTERVGEAVWTFTACDQATLQYVFDEGEHAWPYQSRQGTLQMSRPNTCSGP